jgi:hypothetical protein
VAASPLVSSRSMSCCIEWMDCGMVVMVMIITFVTVLL